MKARSGFPRIAVLLSTHNGETFLADQLESLTAQSSVLVELFARDDGSSDATLEILDRWSDRWPALSRLAGGDRLGPARSFLELLRSVPDDFDYYAFCDQDDVWAPDKLARAVERLSCGLPHQPALYCSRVMCADKDLRPLGPSRPNADGRFEHLLFENIVFGNTAVMNRAGRAAVVERFPGQGVIMHDWWCGLVISALGIVIHDERPSVLYRQHGANCIGGYASRLGEVIALARLFFRGPGRFYPIRAQAREFLRLHGDQVAPERRALAAALVESRARLGSRIRYAACAPMIRSRPLDAIAARGLLIAGWY
ncbi:MAG: glycosyltransferase family 2 protein [Caulobacteraceae bacterium]